MATPTKTLRLRPRLRAEIERIARRTRRSFAEVTQDLLEEALRMRQCPGIYFAEEILGREAKVAGTGLGVWEVVNAYQAVKENEKKFHTAMPHVGPAGLKSALLYYRQHPREIDEAVAENSVTFEALEAQDPGLVRRA